MIGAPFRFFEHARLVTEASILCRALSGRCNKALKAGDMEAYFRLLAVQQKALARWRRRNGAAGVRGYM